MTPKESAAIAREIVDAFIGEKDLPTATIYKTGWEHLVEIITTALETKDAEIRRLRDALEDAVETMSSAQADMLHCFENECCPTKDEVNSFYLGLESAQEALKEGV